MNPAALTTALLLGAGALAQCNRPVPPAGGFALDHAPAVPVTYSDGYQSLGSMLTPSGPAPACGWPLVVYVHPLGGGRFDEAMLQLEVARQGYAVWAYDVRGQGDAALLNGAHPAPGTTFWGLVERYDLAEQIAFVAAEPAFQGLVDTTRLGVLGTSQGGGHAWLAAAWSGAAIDLVGRTPTTFPNVSCAIPRELVACGPDDWLRGGELFSTWWIEALSGNFASFTIDQTFQADGRAAFLAQDPSTLRSGWLADGRALGDRLAQSTVPVLYEHAYHDFVDGPLAGLERLETMQGPTRALLGTRGHGVPSNIVERQASDNLMLRWLHRFLWGVANEVDVERPNVLSAIPLEQADRTDPTHLWSRVVRDALDTPVSAERFYLHEDRELRDTPPATPQLPARIEQTVDPATTTFNPTEYFDQPTARTVAAVTAACPLEEEVWSMTLSQRTWLTRSATLHLEVESNAARWMLAALLTVEAPGGQEVMLTSNAVASRASVPGVPEHHALRLPPVAVELEAGTVVRLRLRNLWLQEAPMQQRLDAAPIFGDFEVAVALADGPSGSWLELPLEPVGPRLVVESQSMELATGAPVTGHIRGGLEHADDPYFVAVGLSGSTPGSMYLGELVPIDGDWLVVASAASSQVYYQGFLGFLDGNGDAVCGIDFSSAAPLPQLLNGYQLTMAAFIWDFEWAPSGEPTNHCDVLLR